MSNWRQFLTQSAVIRLSSFLSFDDFKLIAEFLKIKSDFMNES